ncbi:MAG TPA: hypothetical protein VNK25_02600 [Candidatus Nitrosotenuis sp.]|nr:hypothetical protein [Candidatus Nitrosotenuis sp.]
MAKVPDYLHRQTNHSVFVLFAIFACVILLTQVTEAYAKYSEARKKAAEREKLLQAQEKEKKKKEFEAKKKALDSVVTKVKQKEPKGKAAADSANSAKIKKINDAKTAVASAKATLKAAEKAYNADKTNSVKAKAYEDAKKALEKAKIDLELAKLT